MCVCVCLEKTTWAPFKRDSIIGSYLLKTMTKTKYQGMAIMVTCVIRTFPHMKSTVRSNMGVMHYDGMMEM